MSDNDAPENENQTTNKRTVRKLARSKEIAEIDRAVRAVAGIPRHSTRFILFRKNRRQRAREIETKQQDQTDAASTSPHPVFNAVCFKDLPLSGRTLDGLAAGGFTDLTPIQRISIPQALAGRDVLAAAPTGSGKTLAFIVPMLESLWREKWNTLDGLGALILSPTRELSMQIFDVLRSVARRHTISAGLVIGGKDFEGEREKVGRMNVLVGTPGRILHHMDHATDLDCTALKMLALDEADRILDMGFRSTLDAIMQNLPEERQTLLFSATQTKDIKALARLSLKSPEYLSVSSRPSNLNGQSNPDAEQSDKADDVANPKDASDVKIVGVPTGLSQSYTVVNLRDKLSVLWSFIKTHLKSKMIVFLSSGKQVRFVFEAFCKLRPGMSLLHIHGNMKQARRTEMYDAFCRTKSAALFATDVASRGLDFPDVEWVVQLDCPDDVATYVHRVGRTARFKANGRAMLILAQGKEEKFINRLQQKQLTLNHTRINPGRMTDIVPKITSLVTSHQHIRQLSQRAFVFYLKSIYQKSDKEVFDLDGLDFDALAKSFGLSVTPKVSFKKKSDGSGAANADGTVDHTLAKLKTKTVFGYDSRFTNDDAVDTDDDDETAADKDSKELDKSMKDSKKSKKKRERKSLDDGEGDDDVLTLKKTYLADEKIEIRDEGEDAAVADATIVAEVTRKRKKRKLDLLKNLPSVHRIVFDEDGNPVRSKDVDLLDEEEEQDEAQNGHDGIEDYAASVAERLAANNAKDKERERERVRALHAKQRAKQRELNRVLPLDTSAAVAVLAPSSDSDSSDDDDSDNDDDDNIADISEQEQLALKILQSRT